MTEKEILDKVEDAYVEMLALFSDLNHYDNLIDKFILLLKDVHNLKNNELAWYQKVFLNNLVNGMLNSCEVGMVISNSPNLTNETRKSLEEGLKIALQQASTNFNALFPLSTVPKNKN